MSRSVVHLLPRDIARGAQAYAAEVCDRLNSEEWSHEVLTIFGVNGSSRFRSLGLSDDSQSGRGIRLRALLPIRKFLVDNQTTKVVAHGSEPMLYATITTPRSIPVVYYRIGVSEPGLTSRGKLRIYQHMARRCPLVLGVSQETLDDSREILGVDPDRLRLVPNGRDPSPFLGLAKRDRGNDPVRLLWVSHMTAHKRPDWFVSIVSRLRQRGLPVEGVMVGDGPMLAPLLAAPPIDGIRILGQRDDVPDLMAASDIFCFTSQGENEGMPGVLIEAGMAGLATVSTRVAGASTVIKQGVTGFLVSPDDISEAVEAIANIVTDSHLRDQLGEAAARRCHEQFTLDASALLFQRALCELTPTK